MKRQETPQTNSPPRPVPALRKLTALLLLLCGNLVGGVAQAQGGLPGLPLDNFQFKETHAAYQKDEDIDDQLDNYNVWGIELDLQWETDCGPCITVDHADVCCDGEQRLWETAAEIWRSADISNRVTFLWLDIKDSGNSLVHEAWPANRRDVIRNTLIALLGLDNIYTYVEFCQDFATNGGRWPSWQNLRDRGRKFILILEDTSIDNTGQDPDSVLFIAASSIQAAATIPWATFVNINNSDLALGQPTPNDRWIYRTWPSFGTDDRTTWELGVARGFNLNASDDVNQGYTITDPRTHSPQPLYVDGFGFNPVRLWGTRNSPMNQISSALRRATPGVTLRIRSGNYAGPCTFDKSMVVEKDPRYSGMVIIGGQ